jgi:hypothetical protein
MAKTAHNTSAKTTAKGLATQASKASRRGPNSGRQSTAADVRRRVLRSHNRYWQVEEFEGSPDAVQAELRRLVREGELEHVRRGVYWRGEKSRFGMSIPRTASALREVLGEDEAIGAAEWYATNLLGLSTQVSPTEVLAVSRRPPKGFEHVRLLSRANRTGRRDRKLTDLEVTFLEALEGWDRYVEAHPQTALKTFTQLLDRDDVRPERLALAAKTEPAVVRERLRAVLQAAGHAQQADKIPRARSAEARARALKVLHTTSD